MNTYFGRFSSNSRLSLVLVVATACNFPRPADVGGDAAGSADSGVPSPDARADAPDEPGVVVHVSATGDDANDGLTKPVKTLKHAIGIVAVSTQLTTIALATGRYDIASGETFPYTVPANIAIRGPAGGGAILVGTTAEPGLILDAAKLRDMEFEQFTVAVTGRGTAELANIRVRASGVALRGEASSKLTITGLDVTGTAGACSTGAELNGDAKLTVIDFSSRALGISFSARDQSALAVSNASITGDSACIQEPFGAFTIVTSNTFSLDDSLIDGGNHGIYFGSRGAPTRIALTNTTIRNIRRGGILGNNVLFQMTGGGFVNNQTALGTDAGNWTLTNISFTQQRGFTVELGRDGIVVMRNCTMKNNSGGIYLAGNTTLDLGTIVSPGNNTFQNGDGIPGLDVDLGVAGAFVVNAVGNTWRPNVQGANADGRYSAQRIPGPTTGLEGNFVFGGGCTLQL